MNREEIARSAANEWSGCFKCDGIVNETVLKCEKPVSTCMKWYDGYRASKLALEKAETDTIERAFKWLSSNLTIIVGYYNEDIYEQVDRSDFIRKFREYMEEGKV